MLELEDTEDYQWPKTAFDIKTPPPHTPGTTGGMKSPALNPMTPRTQAFNRLGATLYMVNSQIHSLTLRKVYSWIYDIQRSSISVELVDFLGIREDGTYIECQRHSI